MLGPDLDQFARELREDARTFRVQNNIVLDAHSAPARAVDSRLDRHHGTFGDCTVGGARETRRLMHLEAHAVSETVAEQLAKTAPLDVASRDRIRIPAGHSRANVLW